MKFLIVKCEPLNDGWETDAHRIPLILVNDWKQWEKDCRPKYYFEVYEITKLNTFRLIKEWEE